MLADNDGGLAGIHVGYNWQRDNWVFGIEGDIDWSGMNEGPVEVSTDSFKGDVDFLASLRGRLGVTVMGDGNTLAYATAGVAYVDSEQILHNGSAQEVISHDWGGVIGAGIEHKFTPGISARLETLFYFFGDEDWICQTSCPGDSGADIGDLNMNVFTVRVGVSAHF